MEYIPLGNLENNIGSSGKVPEPEARDITEQILSGLEIMHAESFAHRDLKPQVMPVYILSLPSGFTNSIGISECFGSERSAKMVD